MSELENRRMVLVSPMDLEANLELLAPIVGPGVSDSEWRWVLSVEDVIGNGPLLTDLLYYLEDNEGMVNTLEQLWSTIRALKNASSDVGADAF